MKKIVAIALLLTLTLAGCSTPATVSSVPPASPAKSAVDMQSVAPVETPTPEPTATTEVTATPEPTPTPASGTVTGAGTIGDYDVAIEKIAAGKDYEGKPGVYVYYKWKNNSKDATMFLTAVSAKVFQGGVECQVGVPDLKSKIDISASTKQIKTGIEQEAILFYALNDATSPVGIEVTDLFGMGGVTVKSDFNLK